MTASPNSSTPLRKLVPRQQDRSDRHLRIRPSDERGHADHGWLDTYHTFSFAGWHEPEAMGFRGLRVLNQDRIRPGTGFGNHPHRDMEIISYVIEGGLQHRDSTGTDHIIRPGDVQRMSAGTGVVHSEHNAYDDRPTEFLQIWIPPRTRGLAPDYDQRRFELDGTMRLVVAPNGDPAREALDIVQIHADVRIHAGRPRAGDVHTIPLVVGTYAYVHVARGNVTVQDVRLGPGDGLELSAVDAIHLQATTDAEVLVFDLA